jgi:endonuclease YncB( thermonuclease family)
MLTTLLALTALAAAAQPIYGLAVAGDGDSLTIGETRVRLFGIDAPELDQVCKRATGQWACGKEAADQLATLVTGREVRCFQIGTDQYDRVLARCSVRGVDVNRTMVARGYAVAFRRYSMDYVTTEESAKTAKLGLWSGTFEMPSEVRAKAAMTNTPAPARGAARSKASSQGGCMIKGNRSRRGDWIYHLPGMPFYQQTRPEALFCSEAEARAAGYRRALVR